MDDYKNIQNFLKQAYERNKQEYNRKEERKKKNLKALVKKSKELKKPIPNELLVIVCLDLPVGSDFVEKYKKWLN